MKQLLFLGVVAIALALPGGALATRIDVISMYPGARVDRGDPVLVYAHGFYPGKICSSRVDVWFSNANHQKTDFGSYTPSFATDPDGEIHASGTVPDDAPYGKAAIWVEQRCGPGGGESNKDDQRVTVVDPGAVPSEKVVYLRAADAVAGGQATANVQLAVDGWTPAWIQYELTPGDWLNVRQVTLDNYVPADGKVHPLIWNVPLGSPPGQYRFAVDAVPYSDPYSIGANSLDNYPTSYANFSVTGPIGGDELRAPAGAAVNPSGNLAVADTGANAVEDYGADGSMPDRLASAGLSSPRDIAAAPDGSYYVADSGNARIVHLSSQGEIVGIFGSGIFSTANEPIGVTYTAADGGGVFAVDGRTPYVRLFDLRGQLVRTFLARGSDGAVGIAAAPDGSLYVIDRTPGTILHYTATGTGLQTLGLHSELGTVAHPSPIANSLFSAIDVDAEGRLIVAGPHAVWVFAPDGKLVASVGEGILDEPAGIAAAGTAGDFYVVDRGANRIFHFRVPV
jgi:sugar lactone lactonase YvrE